MRILYVVKNMRLANGVTSYAMNYYRKLVCTEDVKIDFLVVNDIGSPYYDEIRANESKIYLLPSYRKNIFATVLFLIKLFQNEKYDIVHSHVLNSGSIILKLAKHYEVPVRILHAHATKSGDTKLKELRNKFFISISLANANAYFACSKLAGDYLYGKRKYTVIYNAVDFNKYQFNQQCRDFIREEYSVQKCLIVTTVGRFTKQKNPFFIVDIVCSLKNKIKSFKFWWFGNGILEDEVKAYAKEKGADDCIVFFGANDKANEFYSSADVFILPSLFEGLPVVGIEAQISGLPCIFSDAITKEVQISSFCEFIPIDSADFWAKKIIEICNKDRMANIASVKKDNYDIEMQYSILLKKYTSLYEEMAK